MTLSSGSPTSQTSGLVIWSVSRSECHANGYRVSNGVELLAEDVPTRVGIDHGFSFPLRYFEVHGLKRDWATFLDDFQEHWPTDEDNTYVDFVRDGIAGKGVARTGSARCP